jgi:hypothetical protein
MLMCMFVDEERLREAGLNLLLLPWKWDRSVVLSRDLETML